MTIEDIKKIAQEEMNKAVNENLDSSIIFNYISNLEKELKNKDTIINTMQAEFERLEDLEDNTDMLKMELKKKDKIIDLMAKRIKEDSEWFYSDLDNKNENDIKEYFKKKVEEDFNEGDKI